MKLLKQQKAKLATLRAFAECEENHFHPTLIMKRHSGDIDKVVREHTLQFGGLRVLFSIDVDEADKRARHLSLSGKGASALLNVIGDEMGIKPPYRPSTVTSAKTLHLIGGYE